MCFRSFLTPISLTSADCIQDTCCLICFCLAFERCRPHVSLIATLQGATEALQQQQDKLQTNRMLLATHTGTISTSSHGVASAAAHQCLLDSMALVSELAAEMGGLDAQQDYSHKVPGWHPLQLQLQAAASETQQALSTRPTSGSATAAAPQSASAPEARAGGAEGRDQQASASAVASGSQSEVQGGAVQAASQQWTGQVEEAVKQVLLWAQSMHSTEAAEPAASEGTPYLHHCSAYCWVYTAALCFSWALSPCGSVHMLLLWTVIASCIMSSTLHTQRAPGCVAVAHKLISAGHHHTEYMICISNMLYLSIVWYW